MEPEKQKQKRKPKIYQDYGNEISLDVYELKSG